MGVGDGCRRSWHGQCLRCGLVSSGLAWAVERHDSGWTGASEASAMRSSPSRLLALGRSPPGVRHGLLLSGFVGSVAGRQTARDLRFKARHSLMWRVVLSYRCPAVRSNLRYG
jgi:hypothetical protein